MANYELISLNEATPQLVAPTSSDTGTCAGNISVTLDITGRTVNATGDTSAGDLSAMGYTSVLGAILTGQGSTYDVTLVNDADATVLGVPTGTTNVEIPAGSLTVGGFTSTGIDDNASAEKLQIADALISLTSTDVNVTGDLQVGSTDGQQDAQTALQVVGSGGIVSTTLSSSADDFLLSNDGNTGITIVSGLNANGLIAFADAGDGDIGRIDYDHNDNSMSLYTNNTVGLKIDTSQNVDIPAGDLTISAGFQNLGTALEITIATGAVTATQSHHSIDTQSDASSDTLDTINGGTEGDILFIRSVSNDRDIIVGHNTGNIILRGGANVTLSTTNDSLMLIYNGATWDEVLNYT